LADAHGGSEMQHHVDIAQRTIGSGWIGDVADDQLRLGIEIIRRLPRNPMNLGRQIIEHPDLMTCLEKEVRGMGANKACSACDENPRHSTAFITADVDRTGRGMNPEDSPRVVKEIASAVMQ
jgi:hypothetical protein